mmetsp:Transcript_1008/g.2137  ORF Transcript_1008/g.2137 Transcript_1008/m.2137 type:complete len:251 (+) Transcript_1008:505-1257(+)
MALGLALGRSGPQMGVLRNVLPPGVADALERQSLREHRRQAARLLRRAALELFRGAQCRQPVLGNVAVVPLSVAPLLVPGVYPLAGPRGYRQAAVRRDEIQQVERHHPNHGDVHAHVRMNRALVLPALEPVTAEPPLLVVSVHHIPNGVAVAHARDSVVPRQQVDGLTRREGLHHLILLVPEVVVQVDQKGRGVPAPLLRRHELPDVRLAQLEDALPQRPVPSDRLLYRIVVHVVRRVRVDHDVRVRHVG